MSERLFHGLEMIEKLGALGIIEEILNADELYETQEVVVSKHADQTIASVKTVKIVRYMKLVPEGKEEPWQ